MSLSFEAPQSGGISSPESAILGFDRDLPNEIQQQIFEHAARLDGRCAFDLSQVARYVHAWTQPILYKRVVVRSPHAASCLFRTLRSHPRGYFEPIIKSLAFDSSVTLPQAKPLLAELSRRLIVFSLFRRGDSASPFLKFIKSPHLRRLTLVCQRGDPSSLPRFYSPSYDIPLGLLSSLTHIAIVIDYRYSSWDNLSLASLAPSNPNSASYVAAYSAFQNLTHFAVSATVLNDTTLVRKVAKNLRYFAILEPRNFSPSEHYNILRKVRSWENQDESIVILKDLGSPELWSIDDSFRPSKFWKDVEHLVGEGYISDQGDRWH